MDLIDIPKIGKQTIQKLNKLNILTPLDLLNYYPYRYNYYNPENINNITDNETITINGIIESNPRIAYIKRNLNYISFRLITNNKLIKVIIYNRAFIKQHLTINKEISIIGKYNTNNNTFTASNILLKPLKGLYIEPIYHLKGNIKNKILNNTILELLKQYKVNNTLPIEIIKKYNFIEEQKALEIIHNPNNINELKQSKLLLIYKELFNYMFKINYLKQERNKEEEYNIKQIDKNKIDKLIKTLPFTLTKDQLTSIEDILNDLSNNKRMNRLIIGDVGSGKTIVSFIAIYANYLAGYTSALLAPTEILVNQHYENIKKILKINIEVLTSSTKKKDRTRILKELKEGKIDCIIGTHSLLNDEIEINNLGLVITDEQHRFGVNQRKNLQNKGNKVDVLYMSATPIPRTYALTIYGDMDISEIKTKPIGRKPTITKLYKEQDIKECLNIMLEEIKKGNQIYVVSPLVNENEENSLYDVEKLKTKLNLAFNNKISIEILHGQLKNIDKQNIMDRFQKGITKILISTTVIEVGVDVKNATCIVIFNAERFGLSTLHQLRGRVGRNSLDSYCILISNYEKERLKILTESNDGFYISEKDFELRGSGNIFGTKQSGEIDFSIANIKRDIKILKQCNIDTKEFIDNNIQSNFNNYPLYKEIINSLYFID